MKLLLSSLFIIGTFAFEVHAESFQSLECLKFETNPYLTRESEAMTYAYHQAHHTPMITPNNLKGKLSIDFLDRRYITSGANEDWRKGSDSLMTCAEVGEIPNSFFCFTKTSTISNLFLRASIYLEGLRYQKKGRLIPGFGPGTQHHDIPMAIAGADLLASNLFEFNDALTAACTKDNEYCPNDLEKDFYSYIKKITMFKGFTWLVAPVRKDTSSHELIHGQFFNMPKFQAIAKCYYQTNKIKNTWMYSEIADLFDASDEFLMINEFTAMLLQNDFESNALGRRAKQFPTLMKQLIDHHQNLLELLERGGVPVISIP